MKESVLHVWQERKASVEDIDSYDRQRDKLREALTLLSIDRHASQVEELDVEGVLAFAERVLPRAADFGSRPRSISDSVCSSCSSPKAFRSAARASIEPRERPVHSGT